MQGIEIGNTGVTIGLAAGTHSTRELVEGVEDVWRFFPGGAQVIAVQCRRHETNPVDAVASAAGEIVAEYRARPGFERRVRGVPAIAGAASSQLLEFGWQAPDDTRMRSFVAVAADAGRVVVAHGAQPVNASGSLDELEAAVCSLDLGTAP